MDKQGEIIIYKDDTGNVKANGLFDNDTIWFTQKGIGELFDVDRSVITKHIKNIFADGELAENSKCAKNAHSQNSGQYPINKPEMYYNLDMIIAVGYRVNSKKATAFRIWATNTLRDHILKGYTINKNAIEVNYKNFLKDVDIIKSLVAKQKNISNAQAIELISAFSKTWLTLDAYDKDKLKDVKGFSKQDVYITADELSSVLSKFKQALVKDKLATDIFGQERLAGGIESILGNVMQSFGGEDLYKSVEEKASYLLYFIVKNHPFIDGNKRSGAYSFIWFLNKTGSKGRENINPETLTALTILIAESDPKDKDKIIGLILTLLS